MSDRASSQSVPRQDWSAGTYARHARFVSELADDVVAWLAPRPGERILDLGCGDGALTEKLVGTGARLVGVDTSPELLAAARARGLDARAMDGEKLAFDGEFDALFSNAALHWMKGATEVIAGIRRALKPGGRFVAEFGGHGNVAAIVTAMLAVSRARRGDDTLAMPWFFPTTAEYAALLGAAGFTVRRIALIPRPTMLPTGMAEWLKLFRRPFFQQFGIEEENAISEVVELLRPSLCDGAGNWTADYVRLRVEAAR